MATPAKMTIRVTSARGSSGVSIRTAGQYLRLPANTISTDLLGQAVQPTASAKAFWLSVVAEVTTYLNTL